MPGPLAAGGSVALSRDHAHYLMGVLRLGAGADVLLFDGENGEWRGTLAPEGRKAASVGLDERTRPQTYGPDLTLLFAPLKKTPTDLAVRMGTELGVRTFQPVVTARTQSERVNTDRLSVIATEAAEQCERLDVPNVAPPRPLADLLEDQTRILFADERGADAGGAWGEGGVPPVREALTDATPGGWSILIGPEGGFTPEERAALRARPNTLGVSLGPRILKAETAAVAALTLWGAFLGDLSA